MRLRTIKPYKSNVTMKMMKGAYKNFGKPKKVRL